MQAEYDLENCRPSLARGNAGGPDPLNHLLNGPAGTKFSKIVSLDKASHAKEIWQYSPTNVNHVRSDLLKKFHSGLGYGLARHEYETIEQIGRIVNAPGQ
ncbi:MAG: hypothetical protein A2X67_13570 [Ignavibacteria bacterium GWA2_55_11]|nr:MAG: hypothetical protein A2X67_13570 [Ignavibacteria bacterium GWA2_55_11]